MVVSRRQREKFHLQACSFLFSSVFWDLYSAAPERREQHPHSEEAKAFHDYVMFFSFAVSADLWKYLTLILGFHKFQLCS